LRSPSALPALALCALVSSAAAQPFAVASVSPARHALSVPTASAVSVTFTAPVNPSTVNTATFRVFGRWSGVVPGTRSVAPDGLSARFEPARPFFPGETVTVFLTAAVAGAAGGNLAGGHTWSFWTRSAPGSGSHALAATLQVRRTGEGLVQTYGAYAGDLDADGSPDLSLPNEVASDVRVFVNDGCAGFAGPTVNALPANSVPSTNEGSDFNADGRMDLAVGNIGGDTMSVLLGNGAGGYLPHTTYASGDAPRGLAVLDVEGDGDVDVITANRNSSMLALHRNAGDGTFLPRTLFEGGGNGETGLGAADANNDGIADLFVANYNSNTITVLLGNGAGGFTLSGTTTVGTRPWMIAVGDVNGDGRVDVATCNSGSSNASIALGNGAGGLGPATNYATSNFSLAADLGDVDGDGDLDMLVSNYGGANFTVWRNNGAGAFVTPGTLPAVQAGSCMLVVDLDRDGDTDIVGIDELADLVFFFRQAGPSPAAVQAPTCAATLRIDNLANRGGYGGAAPHAVSVNGRFVAGITGAPGSFWSLAVGVPLEPGLPLPIGTLNLALFFFLIDGFGGNPAAVTNAQGEDVELIVVPPGLPPGTTVALQAVVATPSAPGFQLTNPERIVFVP
jgi:hypothetical protein